MPITVAANRPAPGLFDAVRSLRQGVAVEESFKVIDAWLRPRLLRYFLAHGFVRQDGEDLVQKTLLRAYGAIGQLREEDKLLPWLFAIARNVRRTAGRQRRQQTRILAGGIEVAECVADPRPAEGPEDREIEAWRRQAMGEAIQELPRQQRQCLLLQVREALSYEEIAQALLLSAHTVRNHLAQARRALRRALQVGREADTAGDLAHRERVA